MNERFPTSHSYASLSDDDEQSDVIVWRDDGPGLYRRWSAITATVRAVAGAMVPINLPSAGSVVHTASAAALVEHLRDLEREGFHVPARCLDELDAEARLAGLAEGAPCPT